MRLFVTGVCLAVCVLGCARLKVEGPKEAIKVDISMRLDIYQHVAKDIDAIEEIVSGSPAAPAQTGQNRSWLAPLAGIAYAQEGLSQEVEQAAVRRRDRRDRLTEWQARGVLGENKSGLVEVRAQQQADAGLAEMVSSENIDRMIIYRELAQKNNTSVEEVQRLYAQRLQNDAPANTPIQVRNPATAAYEWKIK